MLNLHSKVNLFLKPDRFTRMSVIIKAFKYKLFHLFFIVHVSVLNLRVNSLK